MAQLIGSFVCGMVFGIGLLVSGMVIPTKVLAFLDIFGAWDPSLAVVMAAALAVTGVGYALIRQRERPLFADRNLWPRSSNIDRNLVVGAVLFGAGWGLVGLCPGPALENLATLSPKVFVFVAAMVVGMTLRDAMQKREGSRPVAPVTAMSDG